MGFPISESDSVSAMFGIDTNEILTVDGSTPPPLIDYVNAVGNRTFHAWRRRAVGARYLQRLISCRYSA